MSPPAGVAFARSTSASSTSDAQTASPFASEAQSVPWVDSVRLATVTSSASITSP